MVGNATEENGAGTVSGESGTEEIGTAGSSDAKKKKGNTKKKLLTIPLYDILAPEKKKRKKTYARKRSINGDFEKILPKMQSFVNDYDGVLPTLDVSFLFAFFSFEIMIFLSYRRCSVGIQPMTWWRCRIWIHRAAAGRTELSLGFMN